MKLIAVEAFIYLRVFIFDYKALFVCVKDRTCLRIPYINFWSPVLFTL